MTRRRVRDSAFNSTRPHMARTPGTMALGRDELRRLGHWAAACAERTLPIFAKHAASDRRPQEAVEGARAFAGGARRTTHLRALAWAAHRAAREVDDPAARAAARAASLAAAVAFTHPIATAHQANHILGPAAYAALARELSEGSDSRASDREIRWAVEHVLPEVVAVLKRMPSRAAGRTRLSIILHRLDAGLRDPAAGRKA